MKKNKNHGNVYKFVERYNYFMNCKLYLKEKSQLFLMSWAPFFTLLISSGILKYLLSLANKLDDLVDVVSRRGFIQIKKKNDKNMRTE